MSDRTILQRRRVRDLRALRAAVDLELKVAEAALARLTRPKRPIASCGTDGGYYRHLRTLGQPACLPCKRAHSAAERARSKRSAS